MRRDFINAAYLTYLEQARIAFLAPMGADQTGMILARAEIESSCAAVSGEVWVWVGRMASLPRRMRTVGPARVYLYRHGRLRR